MTQSVIQLPTFKLSNNLADKVSFPNQETTLICFVKEECETCKTVMPLLKSLMDAGSSMLIIGQTQAGNEKLIKDFDLNFPILDDSALKISFAYNIEIVPTLILCKNNGEQVNRHEGFIKEEWQTSLGEIATSAKIEWATLPTWRPGCGSLSVQPENYDRLRAEADNSPLRARKIDIAEDEFEFMFDQGLTDGLPVVPPTPERVIRMLSGTKRDAQEVVAIVPPNMGEASIEKIAINAVMAGCKPAYLPVIIAAVEAACTDDFNIHGVMATTMGASPVMVVNGPIREEIGMNMKLSAMGQGNRANATIGRALRLVIRNVGGAVPGGTERPTLGNPMKFTMCFAEWEERSPWPALHVERGFKAEDSVVTLFCMTSGPTLIVDQTSTAPRQLARSMAMCLEQVHHPKSYMSSDTLLVVCPEHIDTLLRQGAFTKDDLRDNITHYLEKPMSALIQDENSGVGIPAEKYAAMPDAMKQKLLDKFRSKEDIHIVVAGADAGKFSGAFHGWVTGPMGSISVSRKISD